MMFLPIVVGTLFLFSSFSRYDSQSDPASLPSVMEAQLLIYGKGLASDLWGLSGGVGAATASFIMAFMYSYISGTLIN